jgi:hypothetical protein
MENDSFKIFYDAAQNILKRFLPIHMSMLTYSLLTTCCSPSSVVVVECSH